MVPPNNLVPDLAGNPSNLKESHLTDVKRILKYLKEKPPQVPAKYLGGKIVCWSAKKQQSVAMSLAEAEYVAAASYPQTAPAYYDIYKYLMNCPLVEAFTKTPSVVYQNFIREFWCTAIAYNPNPPIDDSEVLNGNYSSTKQVNSIQQLFAYCLLTGIKKKKVKSQTVTSTLPQSQGPEALGLLPQKRKKPKSKKIPTKTKVTLPKPTEGSEQSHSVSSGMILDPQDLERNIQLAGTGFPSTLDECTRKPKLLPEGTNTDPKDSRGNVQPVDKGFPSMVSVTNMT
ncbi:hypothetical protein Tco_0943359 [Tanacetum coccineum]